LDADVNAHYEAGKDAKRWEAKRLALHAKKEALDEHRRFQLRLRHLSAGLRGNLAGAAKQHHAHHGDCVLWVRLWCPQFLPRKLLAASTLGSVSIS
jgi:hypothetical protein